MELSGVITRINFYNQDNGYSVVLVSLKKDQFTLLKKSGNLIGNKLVVVGTFDRKPVLDEEYTFIGEFVRDANYGLQFKFENFRRTTINSPDALIQYLSSDLFPGIGIVTAKNIINSLGTDAIDLILQDKNVLKQVGIKPKNIDVIYETILVNKNNQDAMLFFINYGITLDMCHKIINTLGNNAVAIVKEQPYILMEKIERFSFIKNDALAIKMGIPKDSKIRLKALISYVLQETLYQLGNSYINKQDLFIATNKFLKDITITYDLYIEVLNELINDKIVFVDTNGLVFDYNLYYKENTLASLIVQKLSKTKLNYSSKNIEKAFLETEKTINIELSELQKTAVKAAFTEPLVIITGGPGTGKTTIVKAILNMYVALHKNNSTVLEGVALLAPTGKASKRLVELTNFHAQTIHKFLGYGGNNYFEYGKDNPKDSKLVIIDESSMMDLPLSYQLFSALPMNCQVIIVGDVDQLPSVGPGQVLKDLIDSKEITTIRLNKIHRQAQDSKIIQLAHNVNEGLIPENFITKFPDRIFIPCDKDNIIPLITEWVTQAMNKGKTLNKDIQVLAPMYRCKNGINELNVELQNISNPLKQHEEIKYLGQSFRLNDKVIQLVNRHEKKVMNGDIGIIDSFTYKNGEISGITVTYDFGGVDYTIEELEDLKHAYAISIHKSQGSEFDIVILPLTSDFYYMFKRKLIYTAITRAKKMLVLIGDVHSFKRGISLIENNRNTILKNLIIEKINSKEVLINDTSSAFTTLGEVETDLTDISPYDFLPDKKNKQTEIKKIQENKEDVDLGAFEFEFDKES
ncbi:MAG: ATP-dependent RecD-like DNA helicase [Bacilli bacterium]|nr:ATP-dependent RecD-like DNA helicase [Bacilli bacterium]